MQGNTAAAVPFEMVAQLMPVVSIELLAEAFAGDAFLAFQCDEAGTVRFVCPTCQHRNHNGGSAEVINATTWRCTRCRARGTRWALEHRILEDADRLERLAALLAAEESAP